MFHRMMVLVVLAAHLGAGPTWGDPAESDRMRALEERVRQLEAENRDLREQVRGAKIPEPAAVEARDDLLPEDGWQFQHHPAAHAPESRWADPGADPSAVAAASLRDRLYVKDIVSDAGC